MPPTDAMLGFSGMIQGATLIVVVLSVSVLSAAVARLSRAVRLLADARRVEGDVERVTIITREADR